MGSSSALVVPNDRIRAQAERILAGPSSRKALVLGFDESTASTVEVLVEGASFYPRMLADIAAASSSVHVNQFGFRPGVVGDRFADALITKAAEGVSVRLVVDRQGCDPERGSKEFYDRLTAAGIEVCVVRATRPRVPAGPLAKGGATHWNLGGLGHIDHRKLMVVDGRIGWVGGAGIEDHFQDGRFHDLFLRVEGAVVAQLQLVFLASFRWLGAEVDRAELDELFPFLQGGANPVPARILHNAPGRYRPITDAISRLLENASDTLDVVNPYVTDRGMIRRIEGAARRGVRVRLFVPASANNWASASLAGFLTWLAGPSRSLLLVSREGGYLPPWFQRTNEAGVQVNILVAQGILTTILALLFAFSAAVSNAYWIFMTITTSVYLLMYLSMFVAAYNLRKRQPDHPRGYRAPALGLLCAVGFVSSLAAVLIGFVPPSQLDFSAAAYVFFVGGGVVLLGVIIPLLCLWLRKPSWQTAEPAPEDVA